MSRPKHYEQYFDMVEVVPGVFVDPGKGVYIVDDYGEVACWVASEWEEDPMSVTATVGACLLAAVWGTRAVRHNISDRGRTLDALVAETKDKEPSDERNDYRARHPLRRRKNQR